jgi:hypothetical protein
MLVTINYLDDTGGVYYAFPVSQSLASWSTYRVLFAEWSGANIGRYSANVDSDIGDSWAVFTGATQPANWGVALDVIGLDTTVAAKEVVKVPRAATEVTAGGAITRNIVGGEVIDEVIQGDA